MVFLRWWSHRRGKIDEPNFWIDVRSWASDGTNARATVTGAVWWLVGLSNCPFGCNDDQKYIRFRSGFSHDLIRWLTLLF